MKQSIRQSIKKGINTRVFGTALVVLTTCFTGQAATAATLAEGVNAALQGSVRTDADKARDANRKPLETLSFFKMQPDMRVLELVPGGGWYTKILAPTLYDDGELFVAVGTQNVEGALLKEPGFDKVKVVAVTNNATAESPRVFSEMNFDVDNIDLVLTFRNLHNFPEDGRGAINKAAYDALKPGGYYGVIDHTRRHMEATVREPRNKSNGRRVDPVLMIKEIESIGFNFVDFSDIHAHDTDALALEVGQEGVTGKTDRFTFLFQKPAM